MGTGSAGIQSPPSAALASFLDQLESAVSRHVGNLGGKAVFHESSLSLLSCEYVSNMVGGMGGGGMGRDEGDDGNW